MDQEPLRCSEVSCFLLSSSTRIPRIICGNKMPTRCNRWFLYCRSYCLLNMFRAPLCPSSGAQEYYTGSCCLWYLVLRFSSCRSCVKLWVVYPVCGMLQHHGVTLNKIFIFKQFLAVWCQHTVVFPREGSNTGVCSIICLVLFIVYRNVMHGLYINYQLHALIIIYS